MSGQMSDVIVIDGEEFAVVEPTGDALFDARSHGVSPVMIHTANTRGVAARFRIDEGALSLSELQVGSIDAPPAIGGVEPTTDEHGQTWTYLNLNLPIAWTGDLIAGAQPIRKMIVLSGYLPVHHYEKVLAFDLEEGIVESTEDRSDQVRAFRDEQAGSDGPGDAGPEDEENVFERFLSSLKIRFGLEEE